MQRALGTARVWNVVVKERRVYGGRLKFTLMCTFYEERLAQEESGAALTVKQQYVCFRVVWFPDPSVMRMRGRGKKGLGNNYTPARALEFDLHVPLSGCG